MDSTLKSVRPVPASTTVAHTGPSAHTAARLSLEDIYYTLFRHKRKILLCAVTGVLAAIVCDLYLPVTYESQAKLFVRYVISDGPSPVPHTEEDMVMKSPDLRGETIINSEEQILTSYDSARQVARTLGAERILGTAGSATDLDAAAIVVSRGLTAVSPRFSSVIEISFRHPDPGIVQPVLNEVIAQYLKRHVEIHRSAGLVGDFLAQETDQLRARLAQTEGDLRKAKAKGEVLSLDDTKRNITSEITQLRQQIFAAQADLAEHEAIVQQYAGANPPAPAAPTPANTTSATIAPGAAPATRIIPSDAREEHAALVDRLQSLRNREHQTLQSFTPENAQVKEIRAQIAEVMAALQQLQRNYPYIADGMVPVRTTTTDVAPQRDSVDLAAEAARIVALRAKVKTLNTQLDSVRANAANLETVESTIDELTRKKDLEEANYRRYAASLEQSRINEALGSGKVSNISIIQNPSPPMRDGRNVWKTEAGLAGGGLAAGVAWAFLIELFLDRTVRRRGDIETKLGLSLFLSVPDVTPAPARRLPWNRTPRLALPANGNSPPDEIVDSARRTTAVELATQFEAENLLPFHETLRDRLIGYFERRGLTHKPKLVTVTGISRSAGVTTTAAGLASCLSETGEGSVLLVDLTPEQRSAQYFYHGKPVCELDDLLVSRDTGQVQEKLYVATDNHSAEQLSRVLPKRFRNLVPRLKASDFDYIIFDMPPVSEISVTPRLAGFMDMVLLVIEAEKTSVDVVQRATTLLSESITHVGVVLNKTRTYVPRMILQEDLGH